MGSGAVRDRMLQTPSSVAGCIFVGITIRRTNATDMRERLMHKGKELH
jgi:hypothetical protein